MISLDLTLWLISVVLSLYTTYLVYKIYSFNRLNKGWLLVAAGFLLIVILRVLTLLKGEGFFPVFFQGWFIYDPLLRISNSLCFILGFWSMLKDFENFRVLEKRVGRFKSKNVLKNKR